MTIAQAGAGIGDNPGIGDNSVLDQWQIPFGSWMDQTVDWMFLELGWALDAVEWPFTFLLENVVDNFLIKVGWIWVVVGFFVLGSLVRNVRVGIFCAAALTFCGLLGNEYWIETARTIGYIFVAVVLCVVIGIPIGVACGRVDSVWAVVRPLLDAMQVVHSFVYMLPFVFFFGIGEEAATMVTMVFALPPLIRLTNLGIRQVPDDVVEAARAFGAPEKRILADVQLPLARPAIMTGLNQTLLLAISMLGIAAIMGAGGLGRLLFRAINNQDVALAASAGLAFFLVAVVLDRISQPDEADGGNLLGRIREAWAHRRDPEALVPDIDTDGQAEIAALGGAASPLLHTERLGMLVAGAGAVGALVSLLLPWGHDAGLLSGHVRQADTDLTGVSFNGLDATGGSWFGFLLAAMALWILASAATTLVRPGRAMRFLSPDGALIGSFGALAAALGYLAVSPGPFVVTYSDGVGPWVAVVAGGAALAGAVATMRVTPYAATRPLRVSIGWSRLVGVAIGALVVFGSLFAGWIFDQRDDVIADPEIEQRIEELRAEAEENPALRAQNASIISSLSNEARQTQKVVYDAWNDRGPGLGWLVLVVAALGVVAAVPAVGLAGGDERTRWAWSAAVVGIGLAEMVVAVGWIASLLRATDPGVVSGVGAFFAIIGGFFVAASSRKVLTDFARAKVYDDPAAAPATDPAIGALAGARERATAMS